MTEVQQTIARYVQGSAGNCYLLSDWNARCLIGMLQTGEATEDDFRVAVDNGDAWLARLREIAQEKGCGGWQ